jgi:phosphate:Na+ symporter
LLAHSPLGGARLVVDFHLLFNGALAAAFLGRTEWMARRLTTFLPDPPAPVDRARPLHLDAAALDSPSVALANASRETLRMADMIDDMLRGTLDVICRDDRPGAECVLAEARCVDQLGDAIRRYLADIGDGQTLDNNREGAQGQNILAAVINLEHVADILANGLIECSLRSLKRGKRLAAEETAIVSAMHADLVDCLRLALAVFLQADPADARRLVSGKARFREFEAKSMALSVRLLRTEAVATRLAESDAVERIAEESGLFLRTVRDLRRIHSHLASFAYPILHRGSAALSSGHAKAAVPAAALTTTIK